MSTFGLISIEQELPKRSVFGRDTWTSYDQPQPVEQVPRVWGEGQFQLQDRHLFARDVLMQNLRQLYVMESRTEVEASLRARPTAITLLTEASAQIDHAFGPGRIKAIRVVQDDFAGATIFGIILWPDSATAGVEALARFDRDWWLRNCNRASGIVNFNVELV